MPAFVRLKEANVKNFSLTDFDTVVKVAAEGGFIAAGDIDRLIAFRNDPSNERWMVRKL